MLARGLTVHQAPRLDRGLLRVAPAPNDDPVVLGPLRRFPGRRRPQYFREQRLERGVGLELPLDLAQEPLGDGPGVRKNADGDLRVDQNVLNGQPEGDDGRLVVFARP